MTDFEDFHVDLYHSKMKWMSIQSGYIQELWDDSFQNQINAFSNFTVGNFEIEAHIIASQSYFKEKVNHDMVLKQISICLKEQHSNVNTFTMCLFNRLSLLQHQ